MPIGPRLDRPSVVGDEGRARAASLVTATVVLVGFSVAVAVVGGFGRSLRLVAFGVGLVGAGTALLDRDTVNALFVGHLCFLPGGILTVAGIATTFVYPGLGYGGAVPVLALGVALGLLGLAGGWANVLDDASTSRAAKQGWGAVVVPVIGLVLAGVVGGSVWLFGDVVIRPALFPESGPALSGLFFLVGATALTLVVAVDRVPVVQLTPRERRPALEARIERWRRRGNVLMAASLLAWLVVGTLELAGTMATVYEALPGAVVALLGLQATPWVRVPVALVGLVALLAVLVAWLARRVTAGLDTRSTRLYAPLFGGIALVSVPLPLLTVTLRELGRDLGRSLALATLLLLAFALLTIAALLFMLLYSLVPAFVKAGLIPDRAGGPAVAAAGLLLATAGAGLAGLPAVLVFAGAAGALLVWDVSEFGLGLTVELGHLPDTRRLELLHVVLSAGVAVVAVVLVVGLYGLIGVVRPDGRFVSAMVLAVGGVLVLLVPVRG